MNISSQIRKYRNQLEYSQEELAHKLYVSRQTISNWENGHSYPDIQTLLMLSVLFDVSLDTLVKGDIEIMKTEISGQNKNMNRWAWVMVLSYFGAAVLVGPILNFMNIWWMILPGIIMAVATYAAHKVEQIKKIYNLDTYEKIVAFSEGRSTEKLRAGKSWKDIMSLVGVPAAFILIMLISSYVFSLI